MRATAAIVFTLLIAAVVFIILNLEPATVSLFGLVRITQPIGAAICVSFLAGALIAYLLIEYKGIRRSWQERSQRKLSKASRLAAENYHAGLEALAQGDLGGTARESFVQALAHDPDHVGALLELGNLERNEGDAEAAIQRHIAANARKPGTPAILRALAKDYALAGRVDECIRALDDLLAVAPNSQDALRKKRDAYEAAGRFEEAIEAHQALLKAGAPDDGHLAILRLKAAGKATAPDKARTHLKALLQHEKKCPAAAYQLLGELHWQEGNVRDAVKAWKNGWKATGDVTLAQRLGEAYMESHQGSKALKLCRQAKDARPNEPLPALLYAQAAMRLEAFDEAKKAVDAQPLKDHPAAALLRIELARRADDEDSIRQWSMETAALVDTLFQPYRCLACEREFDEWAAQCPACKQWDTVKLVWLRKVSPPEPESEKTQAETESADEGLPSHSETEEEPSPA